MRYAAPPELVSIHALTFFNVFMVSAYILPTLRYGQDHDYVRVVIRWAIGTGIIATLIDMLFIGGVLFPTLVSSTTSEEESSIGCREGMQCAPGSERWRCVGTVALMCGSVILNGITIALLWMLSPNKRQPPHPSLLY